MSGPGSEEGGMSVLEVEKVAGATMTEERSSKTDGRRAHQVRPT